MWPNNLMQHITPVVSYSEIQAMYIFPLFLEILQIQFNPNCVIKAVQDSFYPERRVKRKKGFNGFHYRVF